MDGQVLQLYESGDLGRGIHEAKAGTAAIGYKALAAILGNYVRNNVHDYDPHYLENKGGIILNNNAAQNASPSVVEEKSAFIRELLGTIGSFGTYKGSQLASKIAGDNILGYILDTTARVNRVKAFTNFGQLSPFLAHRYAFSQGPDLTEEYYTIKFDINKSPVEFPLYIKSKGGSDIYKTFNIKSDADLKELAIKVIHDPFSTDHINKKNVKFNDIWKYTNSDDRYMGNDGDIKGLEELTPFYNLFARAGLYDVHQMGKESKILEVGNFADPQTGIVAKNIRIVKYDRPNILKLWLSNELGSIEYDIFDAFIWNLYSIANLDARKTLDYIGKEFSSLMTQRMKERTFRPPMQHYT